MNFLLKKTLTFTLFIVLSGYSQKFVQNVKWTTQQLDDKYYSEGAHFGDFNKDSIMDIVSGPYWFEGPDFTTKHEFMAVTIYSSTPEQGYADFFNTNGYDINGDGWTDILVFAFPFDRQVSWFENPKGGSGHWSKHDVGIVSCEVPDFRDITGDGKPDVICARDNYLGWLEPNWNQPANAWTWNRVSTQFSLGDVAHGLGIGDVNKDGRMDFLWKFGWWEQPANLNNSPWIKHDFKFWADRAANQPTGGGHMYTYDVDNDGDNDVITSLQAHGWDLAWFENLDSLGTQFQKHMILGNQQEANQYGGVWFSQLHGLELWDINGDGLKDIVTGKRVGTHGPASPNVVYWFELVREQDSVYYVPHLIDDNSGMGTDITVGDVNGDNQPDVMVGNRDGIWVFKQESIPTSVQDKKSNPSSALYLLNIGSYIYNSSKLNPSQLGIPIYNIKGSNLGTTKD